MLLLHSADSGATEEKESQPLCIVLLFFVRERLAAKATDSMERATDYIGRLSDEQFQACLSREPLEKEHHSFERIKTLKMKVLEDCLAIFRTHLHLCSMAARTHFFKLVQLVCGASLSLAPDSLVSAEGFSPSLSKAYSKTLLSPRSYRVDQTDQEIELVLLTWSLVFPHDESLQIVAENLRFLLQNSFDAASIHLSEAVRQVFSHSSFSFLQPTARPKQQSSHPAPAANF